MTNDSDRDRLDALAQKIEKATQAADPARKYAASESNAKSRAVVRAVHIGTDFVALVMGTAFVGWFVDRQLGTAPWFMLGMIIVGFFAGFWMVYRVATKPDDSQDGEVKE